MDRRRFLQSAAASSIVLNSLSSLGFEAPWQEHRAFQETVPSSQAPTKGHTLLCSFSRGGEQWMVYEDLRGRDGAITFTSSSGTARVLPKTAEAVFAEDGPPYFGLDLRDIGMTARDLLADKLLAHGDPEEAKVRSAAPPMDSASSGGRGYRPHWNTFVGTRECSDTMPVYPSGNTRTYHPIQYFGELTQERAKKRHEGLVGGWMPAVRKVLPGDGGSYYEIIVFGDVLAKDRFIVQTWHRTTRIHNGKIQKMEYGYSYPSYSQRRQPPQPQEFYRGLLEFAEYWDRQMQEGVRITLPDTSWANMSRYAFVKEQMVRPGGVYPKYGAVDRDYYGSEYDGFQDTFTMSFYSNMEFGRLTQAREVFDNYFTHFVGSEGIVNMRGPETGQFGLTLSLIARYYSYTGDSALLLKHREKIEATASLLTGLHDEALQLPATNPGYGLIHGWCESDSCLMLEPSVWWKPYFSSSAIAVRGWRDIAAIWRKLGVNGGDALAASWMRHADQLQQHLVASIDANTRRDMNPPYIGPLPGTRLTFLESLAKEHPSEQQWVHRCYAELLQPGVLPAVQANTVIDCMRSYGATTLGVVANVERPHPNGRDILGFISYGYAQALLRLDRIEEYILFLYSHRYHDHSRGSWTAGEVSGITGDGALFCIPAQQTIPLLVRWMLVFEDADQDTLYLGRAVPRAWMATGGRISIEGAPTRWGRVDYHVEHRGENELVASIAVRGTGKLPKRVQVSFRLPEEKQIAGFSVNGRAVPPEERNKDAALFVTRGEREFEVVARVRVR